MPKNVPKIQATFKIDGNGILSVKASYGDVVKGGMKLDVYSKSGGMISKARDKMSLTLSKVMGPSSKGKAKCDALEDATSMAVIPVKPRKSNVLKLYVDSEVRDWFVSSYATGDNADGISDGSCDTK